MATVVVPVWPGHVSVDPVAPPQIIELQGTAFPILALAFDGTVEETCYFQLRAPSYGSGNLTLRILWSTPSGTTAGNVVFGAAIACVTPDTDSGEITSKAFATAVTVTDTHLGTNAQRLHEAVLTIDQLDSIAANDWLILKFWRDGDGAGDTINAVDVYVEDLQLTYSDT